MPRTKKENNNASSIIDVDAIAKELNTTYGAIQAEATKRGIGIKECAQQMQKERVSAKAKRTKNLKGQKKIEQEDVKWAILNGMGVVDVQIKELDAKITEHEEQANILREEMKKLKERYENLEKAAGE